MPGFKLELKPILLQQWSFQKWCADGNVENNTLFKWPHLNKDSLVFDLGGYRGDWSKSIYEHYKSHLVIFEPIPKHVEAMLTMFQNLPDRSDLNVTMFSVATSNTNRDDVIKASEESTSLHLQKGGDTPIKVVDISQLMIDNGYSDKVINLAKINIEGEEFNVIDSLVASGLIKNFEHLIIQCHPFVEDPKETYEKMFEQLSRTHTRVWNYPWIWEYWKLNE